jgi:ABC-2 type transport system permease protein
MSALWSVLVKEIHQLRRDRLMIPVLLVAPLVQLLAFGLAANTDVTRIPTLVVDRDRGAASRALLERFTGSGYFERVGGADEVGGIERWLVSGRAQIALVIDASYGEDAAAGRQPRVQLIADGSDASSAVVGLGYASRVVAEAAADLAAARPGGAGAARGRIELRPRVWYNPDLKSRWFYVPAILAMVLMLTTMILPSMALAREKEIGTLEQIIVTPVRPWQLIIGKLLPFAAVGVLNLLLVTAAAIGFFGVPLRGSLPALVLLSAPFLMTTLGLGLLASTLVRSQQQAMMTSILLMMVPMIYLSGLIFPIENMPPAIQRITWLIPLRYYNVIIRGVFLKGSGLATLWPEAAVLAGMGAGALALAAARFRKSLD